MGDLFNVTVTPSKKTIAIDVPITPATLLIIFLPL
jgi:hypothetical protein